MGESPKLAEYLNECEMLVKIKNKAISKIGHLICTFIPPQKRIDGTEHVFLTFDDGPDPDYTLKISSQLSERGHTGTFFLLGSQAKKSPEVVKDLISQGHTIGSHSSVHRKPWETRFVPQMQDYRNGHKQLEDVANCKVKLFRPPYGHYDYRAVVFSILYKTQIYLWTVESMDWEVSATTETIVNNVVPQIKAGNIVLLHDAIYDNPLAGNRTATVQALEEILNAIEAKGLTSRGLPC